MIARPIILSVALVLATAAVTVASRSIDGDAVTAPVTGVQPRIAVFELFDGLAPGRPSG